MITHNTIKYKFDRKYRFVLEQDAIFYLDVDFPSVDTKLHFTDVAGNTWLEIEGRVYRVKAGYAWNGCSPRPLGPKAWWLGTPDCGATIKASLAHDAGYQFLDCGEFPFTRAEVDKIFLKVMQANRFPLARVYWAAVRTFGGIDRLITR